MTTNESDNPSAASGSDRAPAADSIRREARQMMDKAKQKARSMLDQQKGTVAAELGDAAQALRRTAGDLEQQEHSFVARYADRAAGGLDRLSQAVQDRDVNAWLNEVEDFARRQPVVFFGGAVATGFLLARFMKSSGEPQAHAGPGRAGTASQGGVPPGTGGV